MLQNVFFFKLLKQLILLNNTHSFLVFEKNLCYIRAYLAGVGLHLVCLYGR